MVRGLNSHFVLFVLQQSRAFPCSGVMRGVQLHSMHWDCLESTSSLVAYYGVKLDGVSRDTVASKESL